MQKRILLLLPVPFHSVTAVSLGEDNNDKEDLIPPPPSPPLPSYLLW